MTHKCALNLCCVNSFFSQNAHNTRKSPWELSTQCRHFIYTEHTSGVISASRLICSGGINSFVCTVHSASRRLPMRNTWILFRAGSSLLILRAWIAFVVTEDGKDTNASDVLQFHQQQNCLTSYTVVAFGVCWFTCGHLDKVWKKNIKWDHRQHVWCSSLRRIKEEHLDNMWAFTSKWMSHAAFKESIVQPWNLQNKRGWASRV